MPALQLRQREGSPLVEIVETANGLLEKTDVNVLTLETVVMIETFGADQRDAALTVAGDDLFAAAGMHVVAKLGQPCPGV